MINGYYTTKEAMELLGVSQQRVQKLSVVLEWRFEKVGNTRLFVADDVEAYDNARWHFKALKELGLIKGAERPVYDQESAPPNWTGEVLNEDFIIQCPKCHQKWAICLPDGTKGICRICGAWNVPGQ